MENCFTQAVTASYTNEYKEPAARYYKVTHYCKDYFIVFTNDENYYSEYKNKSIVVLQNTKEKLVQTISQQDESENLNQSVQLFLPWVLHIPADTEVLLNGKLGSYVVELY